MNSLILVLNCGSSSLKGAVLDSGTGTVLLSCLAEKLNANDAFITFKHHGDKTQISLSSQPNHTGAISTLMQALQQHGLNEHIVAIGHRVVHGGERFTQATLIDEAVLADIARCVSLAPLHNPANLLGIRAAQAVFGTLPHVAVFDTAFHQTIPQPAYLYAVPQALYREHGVRRYGFHGTSYRYVAQESARFLQRDSKGLALVIAHLGNGASVCAVQDGQSRDTSMGLTPLEGLVMGTRSGDIDPGIFAFLHENKGMGIAEITDLLNKQSGLLGLSELSNDCRTLEEAAANGHSGAQLALDIFAYRLAKYIAAMTVATGRLDALVFTGGIGENSELMRAKVVQQLGFMGLALDNTANAAARFGQAGIISPEGQKPLVLVIPTNEEWMIAQVTIAVCTSSLH